MLSERPHENGGSVMVFLALFPVIALIAAIWLLWKLPKTRRRRALERAGAAFCSHCLRRLEDVDQTRTEYCPGCGRRLPRFAVRKAAAIGGK